ncbi:DUF3459 domain-containing protein, partial [Mycobacterium tuberculosis]|nr:DUF3459 domain-containing protein [Mycobacterium tuberculosis]MBP0651471.1 DUF3459 domain-containing protein [Mycobacterium tuberculosis]
MSRTRTFLTWRRTVPELLKGGIAFEPEAEPGVLAFRRGEGADAVHCRLNLSPTPATATVASGVTALNGHGFETTAEE